MFRDLSGTLTDLGYLLMARRPWLHSFYRRWAHRRYARLAPGYAARISEIPGYLAPLLTTLPHLPRAPRLVVEIGVGTGAATAVLIRAFPQAHLVAIDASSAMLAAFQPRSGRVHRVAADAGRLPLQDGIADLVIAHNAPFDIEEMRRAAGSNGMIAVVLSSAGHLPVLLRRKIIQTLTTAAWHTVEEYQGGRGVGLVFRRTPIPTGEAR